VVSVAADRAVYAVLFWSRRHDWAAIRELRRGVSEEDWRDAAWVLGTVDFGHLSDDDLRSRMLSLA
jgi:hypothetical protein